MIDEGGTPISLGTRSREVLALLVARVGEVVRSDSIMDELWGTDDASARNSLHTAVSALRRAIGRQAVETRRNGYRLVIPETAVDAWRFSRAVADAVQSEDAQHRLDLAESAEAEWNGEPYVDVADRLPSLRPEIARLTGERVVVREHRLRAMLDLGRAAEAVPELERLVVEQALHEPFWALLVEALADSGRTVDALRAFARARQVLATEVGLPPSAELQELERRIIEASAGDPAREDSNPTFFVTSEDGTRVAFKDFGDGPVLVFIPTWAGDFAATYTHPKGSAFLDVLGDGRRSVWIGYRGVGSSQRDVSDVSVSARFQDVEAVVDHLGLDRFDVYCAGDGVPVAFALAAHHPTRVGRIAAFMPHVGLEGWLSPESLPLFIETMRTSGSFGRRTIADIVLPDESPDDKRWFNSTLSKIMSDDLIARCLELQLSMDTTDIAHMVKAPVLVIMRERSNSLRLDVGTVVAASVQHGSLVSVPGSASLPWLGPGDVATAARRFLDGREPR